ncbi:MAG TPA: hypothetical protein PKY96_11795, partial [Flavobacteriales bacterium]|nr:hypothetical protein [Flavobacteriales bacterium]
MTWRPSCAKYYSLRAGNTGYPLETWNAAGGLSIYQTNTGLDMRGMWWNPNTQQLECNLFNTAGWATIPLDASCNANSSSAANIFFTGMNQPNTNAIGAYDWNTNTVLFYQTGNLHVYSRTTATLITTIPLTGTSLVNVNTSTVIYTGQNNYEIGLLDHVAKRILLFRRSDGAFSGMSQLPAAATTSTLYRFSYANNRVWLYTAAPRTWNAYCIWNEGCAFSTLPVELLHQKAACLEGTPLLTWATATEHNSSHFL